MRAKRDASLTRRAGIAAAPLKRLSKSSSSPANAMMTEGNRFDRKVLLGLIILEALLFSSFYIREVAWYPPDNFDQASYLTETYRLQERIFYARTWPGLEGSLESGAPQRVCFSRSKALWPESLSGECGCRNCAFTSLDSARFRSPLSQRQKRSGSGAPADTLLSG